MKRYIRFVENRGVALILTVGILALMVLIGTSFALNMMIDYKSSANAAWSAKARVAAEAGLNLAITYMRDLATADFNAVPTSALSLDWNYISAAQPSFDLSDGIANNSTSGSLGSVGGGNITVFSLKVVDTASQINVTDTNPGLGPTLESLVAILGGPLQAGDGTAIVTNLPAGGYLTKEQVIDAIPGADLPTKKAKFNQIRDYITVSSYIDQNSQGNQAPTLGLYDPPTSQSKAPININTATSEVLQALLRPIISDNAKVSALAAAIITQRATTPFRTWNGLAGAGGFNDFIDNVSIMPSLTSAEITDIENNANPNRVKPLAYSTDFCFQPSGYYEITSTGTIGIDANSDGDLRDLGDNVVAQKEIWAVVQIYDTINYTTKRQFRGEDANYNGILDLGEDLNGNSLLDLPTFERATWLDSCPVLSSDDQGLNYASNYAVIPNSIKMGFWDNFDEDNDNTNRIGYSWANWQQDNGTMVITDADSDGNMELYSSGVGWPKVRLPAASASPKWKFGNNFSIRTSLWPSPNAGADGQNVTGHVIFGWGTKEKGNFWTQNWLFYYPGKQDLTRIPPQSPLTVAIDSGTQGVAFNGKDYCDSKVILNMAPDLFTAIRNDRTYNIGNVCYGLTDQVTDHYNDYMSEEGIEQYHGVFPDKEALKLVVNNSWAAPNYRAYLAVGTGRHKRWFYNGSGYSGEDIISPPDNIYHQIPFHDTNDPKFDRYGCISTFNNISNTWQAAEWFLILYGEKANPIWDEIRIVPSDGFYQSLPFNSGTSVRWGTVSWTLTIPATADPGKEQCSVQLNTGGGLNNATINGPIGGVSNSEVFRVNLTSTDDDYSETPVFEDITITYLSAARIVYYRSI